jgi:hypothetical protein
VKSEADTHPIQRSGVAYLANDIHVLLSNIRMSKSVRQQCCRHPRRSSAVEGKGLTGDTSYPSRARLLKASIPEGKKRKRFGLEYRLTRDLRLSLTKQLRLTKFDKAHMEISGSWGEAEFFTRIRGEADFSVCIDLTQIARPIQAVSKKAYLK